jgi:hypothetical protein
MEVKLMVCYTVPLVAAISHFIMSRNITTLKASNNQQWLTLLLSGGAIFGVVDHWWNGELFLFGESILFDLTLGVVITAAIVFLWAVISKLDRAKQQKNIKA